jgi:redox-sensitive bicupin YhaK (pirin superfamily)
VDEPRIRVCRGAGRFRTLTDWADTRHSFSFGEHYDPANTSFGALLVHNEDLVRSGTGYADHPHRDAEIITWVLSGSLVHEDSRGHTGIVHRGLAQRMSAGSGIVHAERNDAFRLDPAAPEEPVHFVQMWVRPDEPGGQPSYQQRQLDVDDLGRHWLPVVSGHDPDAVIKLASRDSTLWLTALGPGESRRLPAAARLHVYLARGVVEVESVGVLEAGDALRLLGEAPLSITGIAGAELLAWELAA